MTPDDSELVLLARAGDKPAFERLVERHGESLLAYLLRLTRRRDDALDLLQDSLLSAWRSLSSLRDPAAFRPWLATIATNVFRKRARRAVPPGRSLEDEHANDIEDGERPGTSDGPSRLASEERSSELRGAIESLPARQRAVLSLRLDVGLPFQEIGRALGITEENARAHHYQALKSLKARLPRFAVRDGADR